MREFTPREKPIQDLVLATLSGTLWGALWGFAIMSHQWLTVQHNPVSFLMGLSLAIFWCTAFSLLWKFLMAKKDESSKSYLLAGLIWGLFLGTALSGMSYGIFYRDVYVGIALFWSALAGTLLGFSWHVFHPPLVVSASRIWGRQGAFLGAVWGCFIGAILGLIATLALVFGGQNISLTSDKFLPILLMTIMLGGGNGAFGGMISGMVFGGIIMAKPLPFSLDLSGLVGATLGIIWGCFLGAIDGAFLGAVLSLINPDLFYDLGFTRPVNFLQGAISIAGLGTVWGMFSGSLWGGLGKW